MAHFDEHDTQPYDWQTQGVYVIEPTDYVEGGEDGVSNRQARELTRRTRNLHERMIGAEGEIDSLLTDVPIKVEAALRSAGEYTDARERIVRGDMAAADVSMLTSAKSYADQIVAALVDGSPELLNTLEELAGALGNDPNFATTVMTEIGKRVTTEAMTAALAEKAASNHSHSAAQVGAFPTHTNEVISNMLAIKSPGTRYYVPDTENRPNQYGVTLDFNERDWYYRLAFDTDGGNIHYYNRINGGDYQYVGRLYHSGNFDSISKMNSATSGLSGGIDLNSLHTTGFYDTLDAVNAPCPGWIYLQVIKHSGGANWVSQTAYTFGATNAPNRIFHRNGINTNDWSPWVEHYHTGNLTRATTAADGLMAATDKAKLDAMPTQIIRGTVDAGGTPFGTGVIGGSSYNPQTGILYVMHSIGHTNYSAIATVVTNNSALMDNLVTVAEKNSVSVAFRVTQGAKPEFAPFDFIIIPH